MATFQCSCLGNPDGKLSSQAIVHKVTGVGHDLVTKPPPPDLLYYYLFFTSLFLIFFFFLFRKLIMVQNKTPVQIYLCRISQNLNCFVFSKCSLSSSWRRIYSKEVGKCTWNCRMSFLFVPIFLLFFLLDYHMLRKNQRLLSVSVYLAVPS